MGLNTTYMLMPLQISSPDLAGVPGSAQYRFLYTSPHTYYSPLHLSLFLESSSVSGLSEPGGNMVELCALAVCSSPRASVESTLTRLTL